MCEMGFGEKTVLIQIFNQNRPSTPCAKLSSVSTIPHKQITCVMGFGELTVVIHIFHQNRPFTRRAKLSSLSTIPHKQRTCEMGFGEMVVPIHILPDKNRRFTRFVASWTGVILETCYPFG